MLANKRLVCSISFLFLSQLCSLGSSDDYLDAVVEFRQPAGSHEPGKSHGNALGAPDNQTINIDTPESLIVAFVDNLVVDGPGDDLFIDEHVNGDSSVNIFGSEDGTNYEFLVQTNGSESIDLADYPLNTLKYLFFQGLGNGGTTPGYDLDGAVALNSVKVGFDCPTSFHIDSIIAFDRPNGAHHDGDPIESIFNAPDSINVSVDIPEVLEVGFSTIEVVDGPGTDFYVYEHINGDSQVDIFGSSNGTDFELLATTNRSVAIDLDDSSLDSVRVLMFVGIDNGGTTPGYELDSVVALNFQCVDVVIGDVNLDGAANLLDVDAFIFQLVNDLYMPQADINQDGDVCLLDVAPFVDLLNN